MFVSKATPAQKNPQESAVTPSTERASAPVSIDPEAAEDLLTSAQLGPRIKRLRLKRSMGLVELGKQTGLSASFLSQLETGRVVPTIRNLARIALVFGKDLSYFFESNEQQNIFRVQRKQNRVRLPIGTSSLTPDYIAESFGILVPEGGLRPCLAEFLPGEERNAFTPEIRPGVEMLYILSGCLQVTRKGEVHLLEPRDVAYISSETQRSYRAEGSEAASVLIISFDHDPAEIRRQPKRLATVRADA